MHAAVDIAPRSNLRHLIVPTVEDDDQPRQLGLFEHLRNAHAVPVSDVPAKRTAPTPEYRRRWAQLLSRVLDVEALDCPHCPRKLRIVAFVTEPGVIASILRVEGLTSDPPCLHPARAPPQLTFPFRSAVLPQRKSA